MVPGEASTSSTFTEAPDDLQSQDLLEDRKAQGAEVVQKQVLLLSSSDCSLVTSHASISSLNCDYNLVNVWLLISLEAPFCGKQVNLILAQQAESMPPQSETLENSPRSR